MACQAILSFGRTPLANALRRARELTAPEPTFPLDLVICRGCRLVQITQTVPPDVLFRAYPYFSSVSDALVEHARQLAQRVVQERGLGQDSLVVEVASNDGYLLQHYQRAGVRVLGIDPAYNVARVARARGIPTVTEFFGRELADQLTATGGRAEVIHAHNVLAHVPDLNGFLSGIRQLLADHGVAIIEVPYLRDLIDQHEFDTIYHEHLCYFSLTALAPLMGRNGLHISRVERLAIHGGSLRLFVERRPATMTSPVDALLDDEARWGVNEWDVYARFAQGARQVRRALITLLDDLRGRGHRIAAYGAAAKGSSLLNFCGIGAKTLDFVVDRSLHKQGQYLPGSGLPIHAPEKLLELMPDYVLLLAWNFADEVLAQQAEYLRRGGRFIVPIPTPAVMPS